METAMDVVMRAEIDHDELVRVLKAWHYEPQYKTTGLADDWQIVENSFDAVEFAYMSLKLISADDYAAIVTGLDEARDVDAKQ